MQETNPKIVIGFITYGKLTSQYLPYFLPAISSQTASGCKVIAIDHSEEEKNKNQEYLRKHYPDLEFSWIGENLGFAKGFNYLVNRAKELGAKYFLAINPDMIADQDLVKTMVQVMERDKKIAAINPKILLWDFNSNEKTNIIDSCGVYITRQHRFSDRKQGEEDRGDKEEIKEVFGFTGACVLLRIKALEEVAFCEDSHVEYFDELMFMYKEDADLSYRLRLSGWKIVVELRAKVYHHRTASPKGESNIKIALNRLRKDKRVKKWSFINHWIILLKIKDLPFSWRVKFATAWYQLKSIIFVLLFEQYLLKELVALWKIKDKIKSRREQLKVKIDIKEIEKFMENDK
jgi:GT2 family glycosyltransferase